MNDDREMTVTIDDAIRARPDLLAQVEDAQRYFEEQYFDPPLDRERHNPSVAWRLKRTASVEEIGIEFKENDDLGERGFGKWWPARYMADPVARTLSVSRSWGEVLRLRSDQRMRKIERLMAEIKSAGEDDLANAS